MNAPAAIQGDYVDLKFLKSRKVCQIVIEIPIEAGETFVAAFGTPNPATGVPVAIARLDPNAKPEKARRSWDELSIAQQAGILCCEKDFHKFVGERLFKNKQRTRKDGVNEEEAAWYVRTQCGVNSRADIEGNTEAERKFKDLQTAFDNWPVVPA